MSLPRRVALPALLLASVLLGACGGSDDESPGGAQAGASSLAVTLAPAQLREIERSIVVSGPVSPWEEMQLGVELSGVRVTSLNVDVGQAVRRGQVLLELDARTLESELAQAQAAQQEAEAGVALASTNFNRSEGLAAQQLISAAQLDQLRAARVQAQARRATTGAQRDAARLRRDFARLRAPADGIISRRLVQPGQVVSAGTELLRLIRDGRLEWRAELAEADLARVQPGAAVTLPSVEGDVQGRVRAVSPGVDSQTRTGTVYADLPEPGALRPGSYVEGRILTGAGKGLTVPAAAVVQRDGNAYVFTLGPDNTAQRRRVRTGASVVGFVEIIEGVKPGESVVEQGAGFLGDGDVVRVVAAQAAKPGKTP